MISRKIPVKASYPMNFPGAERSRANPLILHKILAGRFSSGSCEYYSRDLIPESRR